MGEGEAGGQAAEEAGVVTLPGQGQGGDGVTVWVVYLCSLRDELKKKHVIFSDIVTIAFDPHPR